MRSIFRVGVLIVVLAILLLLVPERFRRETLLQQGWSVSAPLKTSETETGFAFSLEQHFGYINEEGLISHGGYSPHRVSMHDDGYVQYGKVSEVAVIFDARGVMKGRITVEGYPFYRNDELFLLSPTATSAYRLNEKGSLQWAYHGNIPITHLLSQSGTAIIITLTGDVITSEGVPLLSVTDDIAPVYAAALSEDASNLFLYQHGKTRSASLYALENMQLKKLTSMSITAKGFTDQAAAFLDEKTVVFGAIEGLFMLRTDGKSFQKSFEGALFRKFERGDTYFFSLHQEGRYMVLSAWEYPLILAYKVRIPHSVAFFRSIHDAVYLGFEDTIVQIAFVKD